MKRLIPLAGLFLTLAVVFPSDLWAQKKDKKDDKNTSATPKEYQQLQTVKELVGEVAGIDPNSRVLTLRLNMPQWEANPGFKGGAAGGGNPLQKLMQSQAQAMRNPNPVQRAYKLQQINAQIQRAQLKLLMGQGGGTQNGPYRLAKNGKDFELVVEDKADVRKMFIGVEYDDKGNIKEYSKAELAKLRGSDTSKPGYAAKLADVQAGTQVRLSLTPPKNLAKKDDTKDKGEGVGNVERPTVRMIVMLNQVSSMEAGSPKGKK